MITIGSFTIEDEKIESFSLDSVEEKGNENQTAYFVENIQDEIRENYSLKVLNLDEGEKNTLYYELRKKWLLKGTVAISDRIPGSLQRVGFNTYVDFKGTIPTPNDFGSYNLTIKLFRIVPAEDLIL